MVSDLVLLHVMMDAWTLIGDESTFYSTCFDHGVQSPEYNLLVMQYKATQVGKLYKITGRKGLKT